MKTPLNETSMRKYSCFNNLIMASMKELFPLHPPKRVQRNFIKENIRNAKGCAQCIAERRAAEATSPTRSDSWKASAPKCYIRETAKMPSAIKYNVKIVKRDRSSSRGKHLDSTDRNRAKMSSRGCQTENKLEGRNMLTTCENCGHSLLNLKDESSSPANPETENNITDDGTSNEITDNQMNSSLKSSHQISHENVEEKREVDIKKLQNPATYKKGEVPRYLKERNAQLERDRQERETKEKLEEILGFKDPKCPPGHMLMPPDELQQHLSDMETKFNTLVAELNRMPVSNDSYKIRQRSIQIEKELRELEAKIELYKTKRVFVKIPEPQ